MDKINMRCPSCTGKAIFIGTGGYLTCSHIDCPEPDIARKVKQLKAENKRYRDFMLDQQWTPQEIDDALKEVIDD